MLKVFTRLRTLVRNPCTIVSDGFRFSWMSGDAARRWWLRICFYVNNWLYSGNGRRERCPRLLPTGLYSATGSLVRLAWCIDDRQTSHFDRLASQCIPPLLAPEVATRRQAASDCRSKELDSAFSG